MGRDHMIDVGDGEMLFEAGEMCAELQFGTIALV